MVGKAQRSMATKNCRGKRLGKESQRVYRQRKKVEESNQEKESRLAKRREARREAKGKQNVFKRVYNADKMQNDLNEIKDEETERLKMTKHETPSEIDDERARIIEILKEHFPRACLNGQEQRDNTNNEVQ